MSEHANPMNGARIVAPTRRDLAGAGTPALGPIAGGVAALRRALRFFAIGRLVGGPAGVPDLTGFDDAELERLSRRTLAGADDVRWNEFLRFHTGARRG